MRKVMVSAILGTDMTKHFTMISNFNTRFGDLDDNPLGTR